MLKSPALSVAAIFAGDAATFKSCVISANTVIELLVIGCILLETALNTLFCQV